MFRLYVAVHQKTLSIPGYAGTHQPDIYVVSLQVSHIHCHAAAIGRKRGFAMTPGSPMWTDSFPERSIQVRTDCAAPTPVL